eukprot:scaffold1595_cov119-Isochrysis_galbana.AAC.2
MAEQVGPPPAVLAANPRRAHEEAMQLVMRVDDQGRIDGSLGAVPRQAQGILQKRLRPAPSPAIGSARAAPREVEARILTTERFVRVRLESENGRVAPGDRSIRRGEARRRNVAWFAEDLPIRRAHNAHSVKLRAAATEHCSRIASVVREVELVADAGRGTVL